MANITDNLSSAFDDWNISLGNSSFSADGDNDLDFYDEVETYWMSQVKLYVVCFSVIAQTNLW